MNRNTTVAIVIIVVLALLGLAVYSMKKNSETPAATDTTQTTDTTDTTSNPQTSPAIPGVKTSSTAYPTDTTVVLSGTVTPNGAFTNYWYEYGASASLGVKSSVQMLGSGYRGVSAPAYITGLSRNTLYYFRLVGENRLGKVAGSTYSFSTTNNGQVNPLPVGSAPAPTTVAASGISRSTANLNAKVNPNGVATTYWFEYGRTAELGNTIGFISAGNGTAAVPVAVSVSDLNPLSTYYFRVNAQNQFGTVNGAILTFKTNGPTAAAAPTAATKAATSIAATSATLRGTVNPNGDTTTYWFEYSTDSLLGSVLLKATEIKSADSGANTVTVSADVSGLASKTNYYYRIVAKNDVGTTLGDKMTFKTK